jgi:FixJ family two-component response regulator
MIATSHIENGAVAQMRMTPSEKPSSEVICLVDDDPMVLRSTGRLLVSDGFAVRPFDKGEDFIAYVASHDVPLVVLDIWMEEMTGLEVLARLCAISPQTRVIVITGREDSAARITAMQIGIVAFLIKPFDDEQFLEMVHRELGHSADTTRLIKLGALAAFEAGCLLLPHGTKVPIGRDRETCEN